MFVFCDAPLCNQCSHELHVIVGGLWIPCKKFNGFRWYMVKQTHLNNTKNLRIGGHKPPRIYSQICEILMVGHNMFVPSQWVPSTRTIRFQPTWYIQAAPRADRIRRSLVLAPHHYGEISFRKP